MDTVARKWKINNLKLEDNLTLENSFEIHQFSVKIGYKLHFELTSIIIDNSKYPATASAMLKTTVTAYGGAVAFTTVTKDYMTGPYNVTAPVNGGGDTTRDQPRVN
jgi:hypothetical protein